MEDGHIRHPGDNDDAFLVRLDDTTRPLEIAEEIMHSVARLLGSHLDADRCAYADVEGDEDTFNLTGDYNRGVPSIVGRYRFAQFGGECLRLMRADAPFVVEDSESDPRTEAARAAYRQTMIRAVVCVPLHKGGHFVAAMALHQATPRRWTADDITLVRRVANRCWESIERSRISRGLRESEARLNAALEAARQIAWEYTPQEPLVRCSVTAASVLGLTLERGRVPLGAWEACVHPEDRAQRAAVLDLDHPHDGPYRMEFRWRRPDDGSVIWVEENGRRDCDASGHLRLMSGLVADITVRRQMAEAQARLASIVQSSDDAIISKTLDGIITSWNRGAQLLFGFSAEEAIGRPMTICIPPELVGEELMILQRIAADGHIDHYETVRQRQDGSRLNVSITVSPIKDDHGIIVGACKITHDISEQKRVEARMQAQLERLDLLGRITRAIAERHDLASIFQVVIRSLEDKLPVDFGCACLYDQASKMLTVTSVGVGSAALAAELALPERRTFPIDENGLSRCAGGQLVYEPDTAEVPFPFARRLSGAGLRSLVAAPLRVNAQTFGMLIVARRQASGFSSSECEFLLQLSEHVALAAHHSQLYASLEHAYEDLRQTQQAVMQQERLRILGQMASGIAHDINNAISPVLLYTESILEREPGLSPRTRSGLETIQRAVDDVAHTVGRLREFYRQGDVNADLSPLDINPLVHQVLELTRIRWSGMAQQGGVVITTRTDLAEGLPAIMGIASEIRESLVNLVFNAVDAMPRGGTLTLRTWSTDGLSRSAFMPMVRQVHVAVTDTGTGMDEATRRRCLEPFFTTKGERGTGLGLAMTYGVMQRHQAEVAVETEVGKGTTICLSFPVSAAVAKTATLVALPPPPSHLRLLIVDDDPILLTSLADALGSEGHEAVTANGGQRGVDLFRIALAEGRAFDVVITDLGMPYLDGREVAKAVKESSPATPVILLTGWGQRMIDEGDVPPHVDRILSKPPKLRELRAAFAGCCTPRTPGASQAS